MDYRAIAALITRTGGLVLIVVAFAAFPTRFAGYALETEPSAVLFLGTVVLPVAIPLAVGAVLMWLPGKISALLIEAPSGPSVAPPSGLQALVFAGIGLYVTVDAVLDLIWVGTLMLYTGQFDGYDLLDEPQTRADLVASIAGLLLGLVLLFGAKSLSRLVSRLRS